MINIKFKKLLKKLFVFNVVTLMSCNLVPSQTIADPINVPVSGDENTTIPLDLSNLSPISVDPDTSTGQNVTLNITINKIDPAIKEFKTAADFFVKAANLAKTASAARTAANWAALASASMEAAKHTVSLINDNAYAYAAANVVADAYAATEYGAYANAVYVAATAARDAVNNAVAAEPTFDYDEAITSAKNAANSVTNDFVDVIYGDSATHDLWVRLTAKTKDDKGKNIDPAPPNASESTEWVKITNITENKNADEALTSVTVSADMGKALMPGDYNVSVILTTKQINISECTVTGLNNMEKSVMAFPLPNPIVKYGEITLEKDKDYNISYTTTDTNATIENEINAIVFTESGSCSVTATITGMGDYMGEVEKTFEVKYQEEISR